MIFHDIGSHLGQKRGFLEPHFDFFDKIIKVTLEIDFLTPKNVLLYVSHICIKYTMLQNVFCDFRQIYPKSVFLDFTSKRVPLKQLIVLQLCKILH